MKEDKKIVIIAGPNGAGKTTFAREFLVREAGCPVFVNADLIAAGLSPFQPEQAAFRAGRLMLAEIKDYVQKGESFAFETTLSGRHYARKIREWRSLGYRVKLIFLRLASEEIALDRVRNRVVQGGHNIEQEVIRRRFRKGLINFKELYRDLVNAWVEYDNSGETPKVIAVGENE
ncbi:MAG: zeta toxin family protein [Desulfocapsa sp.]|nr:zeta toxin family protein [Desulfocapsa sp.]